MGASKISFFIISFFIALCMSGDLNVFGVKLNVLFGILTFLIISLNKNIYLIKYKYDLLILYLLLISIAYVSFIDILEGRDSTYNLLSKSFVMILSYVVVRYFAVISIENIEKILINSNYIMLLFNLVILSFAVNPAFAHIVNDYAQYGTRLKGFEEQTNGLALTLIFNISIAFYNLILKRSTLNIIAFLISITLMVMTQSRGLLVAMFLSIFTTYLLTLIASRKSKQLFKVIGIFLTLFLILGVFIKILPDFLSEHFGIQMERYNEEGATKAQDFSADRINRDRMPIFLANFETFLEYPFGIGFVDNHLTTQRVTGISHSSHNIYIQHLLQYGLPFVFLWYFVFFYPLWFLYNRYKKLKNSLSKKEYKLFILFFVINIQILIFLLSHSSESIYIWFFLGFTIACVRNIEQKVIN